MTQDKIKEIMVAVMMYMVLYVVIRIAKNKLGLP